MRIEIMSSRGHDVLAEWDQSTPICELEAIRERFERLTKSGCSAFGVESRERLDRFDPMREEDVVFVRPMVGG